MSPSKRTNWGSWIVGILMVLSAVCLLYLFSQPIHLGFGQHAMAQLLTTFFFLPALLLAGVAWFLSRGISSILPRISIFCGLISIAFIPTLVPVHHGALPFPFWLAIIAGEAEW